MTHLTLPAILNTTMVILSLLITTLIDFWYSPLHLVFTYLIPMVPLFYAVDGYVSCIRGRTAKETWDLLYEQRDLDLDGWELVVGRRECCRHLGRCIGMLG